MQWCAIRFFGGIRPNCPPNIPPNFPNFGIFFKWSFSRFFKEKRMKYMRNCVKIAFKYSAIFKSIIYSLSFKSYFYTIPHIFHFFSIKKRENDYFKKILNL